ncbi:hypothetical protein ACFLU6_16665 [Acidobacteriota bacterium]
MNDFLHFASHRLQEVCLVFMALVYTIRLIWLLHFKAGRERQAATGQPGTTPRKGILYSWFIIAQPWAMESSRSKLFLYFQFVIFHLGVVCAIGLSFIIPYASGLLSLKPLLWIMWIIIGGAFCVGLYRIVRRISDQYMRAISTPDDYFSLILLTVWFFFAFLSVSNSTTYGKWHLVTYFLLTAFFLVYVPFSKISHYLYYPFTRYYFGKSMGYRGVYPIVHSPKPKSARG